jgi:hypothetical protein
MLIEQRPGAAKSISFLVECSHLGFSLSVTSRGVDTTLVSFLLVEIPMGLEVRSGTLRAKAMVVFWKTRLL